MKKLEDRLLAACDRLNRPQHQPHSRILTWDKVHAAFGRGRRRGSRRRAWPRSMGSRPGCAAKWSKATSGIPRGIASAPREPRCAGGSMPRLTLASARPKSWPLQLKHIDFKPVAVKVDGKPRHVLVITLPGRADERRQDHGRDRARLRRLGATEEGAGQASVSIETKPRCVCVRHRRRPTGSRVPAHVAGTVPARRARLRAATRADLAHHPARVRLAHDREHGRSGGDAEARPAQGRPDDPALHARRHSHLLAAAVRLNRR